LDIFTKTMTRQWHHFLVSKLMFIDLSASIWRGVKRVCWPFKASIFYTIFYTFYIFDN
jgi:hypothetical protein